MVKSYKSGTVPEQLLRENHIEKPPVPIFSLVRNYGITVKEANLPDTVAGILDSEKQIIYLNQEDSLKRKNFSLAHELGHFLLHAKALEKDPKIGIFYRKPLGRKGTSASEHTANQFAANLLVPFEMLEVVLENYGEQSFWSVF
jgi:Zn-dependent peptidase ImmA (M78 family)